MAANAQDSRGGSDHIHADERSTRDSALDRLVPVNRSLAKALLALTYPLRLTAHLTDSAPHSDHARTRRNGRQPGDRL